jgi:hypothetical protein
MKKKRIPRDPEKEARSAEARRMLLERIEYLNQAIHEELERTERRRERLRRLTFGLLPR